MVKLGQIKIIFMAFSKLIDDMLQNNKQYYYIVNFTPFNEFPPTFGKFLCKFYAKCCRIDKILINLSIK